MANQPTKYRKFVVGAASAALVASAVAPVASAADFNDTKGNTHEEAINALVEAGIVSGYPDGTFLPNKTLTRSDVVKFMGKWLVSLGYDVPEDYKTNPRFTDQTSKTNDELLQYSALVKDHGVFNGYENGSLGAAGDITRENMAIVLVRAYDAINETDLVAFVEEQTFDKDVTDRATAKAEARPYIDVLDYFDITNPAAPAFNPKATTTRGQFASFLYKTSKVEAKAPVVTATKVESVSATNLKEVVVTFDGTVDEDTATDVANYALKSGKAIKGVAISDDHKSVTVTLEGTLTNNKTEAISVSNVKAGDNTINEKNVEFKVEDNKLPEVTEIKSLGTKSVKVAFSEPVVDLQQNNFTLDGKAYFGKVTMGAGNKSVILTPYSSSALEVGDHKLTVSGVKDYAGFVSLNSLHDFTVVEDKVAPTITEATATLESVTLTFSEDVDWETISASKVYWKSGDSKKVAADVVPLADNKYKFVFSTVNPDNSLPTGKVDIYVEGVKDYSGNEIAKDTTVTVTPEIDQTRPEVRKVVATGANTFKITFSKTIDAASAGAESNYIVTDKDGKVISVKNATRDNDDFKSVNVELYQNLSVGENKLTVKNVKDATKLKNTMLDYTGKIVLGDTSRPTFTEIVSVDETRVVLSFNEKMDVDTLVDYSNYLVKIDNQLRALTPEIAEITVLNDGTAVSINFAERFNSKKIKFATGSSNTDAHVSELQILGLKDVAGNLLDEFAAANGTNVVPLQTATTLKFDDISSAAANAGLKAQLVDTQTLKVKFNAGINSATSDAFTAVDSNGNSIIDSVNVDGTSIVTLKLKADKVETDGDGLNLTVDFGELQTVAGKITAASDDTIAKGDKLLDSVAPIVKNPSTAYASVGPDTVEITYSEALTQVAGAGQELLDKDFTIVRVSDNKELNANGDYDVTVGTGASGNGIDTNKLQITFTDGSTVATAYKVTVNKAQYVTDTFGNKIADSTGQTVQLGAAVGAPALVGVTLLDATGAANNGKSVINLPAAGSGNSFKYIVSSNASPVPTPAVGANAISWTTVANTDVITVANGKNVGVAEVTAAGKVVKFVNVVAANADYVAATSGNAVGTVTIADDSALAALTTSEDTKALTITVDSGTPVSYTVAAAVTTKADFLSALNTALGSNAIATFNASNQLVITSASTGISSTVVIGGAAASALVGTPVATPGAAAQN